ncbi:MAG: TRAP transporter substrate-binding protein [Pseudomonadota bacterium]|nr:TRAP transporter substrate-binding protein [Pseudomonadota bacterium]
MTALRFACSLGLLTAAALLAETASSQEFTARIGHLESAQQARHQGLEKVAQLVKERTNGAVEFQLFPAGQLGQAREMNEGVQLGLMEGTVSPAAFLAGFNPAVSVLDIPFLYPADLQKAADLRNGAFGEAVLASFEPLGFEAVAIWPNGRKSFTSNKPLDNVEAFGGQRFRVMDSPVLMEQFNAVGASAVALPFGELYTALQTGVVDGQENALDTIATMKYNEVQDNLLVSGHGANEDVVLFNPAWWNSLPEEHRQVITEAFEEIRPQVEEIKEASQDKALEALTVGGMNVRELTEAERASLREVMYPRARDAYLQPAGEAGQKIIETYEQQYEQVVGG